MQDIDRELDAVAVDDDARVIAVGTCKWTAGVMPYGEKARLDTLGAHLAGDGPQPTQFYFSRGGFAAELEREARRDGHVRLVVPAELF